jgi:endonuclease/exonuclease/phosphatase (EEP) superfamily protein YafD
MPVWNSQISNRSGTRLLNLQDNSDFQISAPQYPTHYTPSGSGDVLDIVLHRNVRISEVNVVEILDSDHLPILFHMLDHVSARDI